MNLLINDFATVVYNLFIMNLMQICLYFYQYSLMVRLVYCLHIS